MAKRLGVTLAILMMFTSFAATAGAGHGSGAIKTMASILTGLNHHPSSSEKQKLQKIVNDNMASMHARTLAQAMINLDHKVISADKPKLQQIVDDAGASQQERDLANILLNLSHKPSSADKDKLHAMH